MKWDGRGNQKNSLEQVAIRSPASAYGLAVAALVAALVLRWLLNPFMGDTLPLVTMFGAVAIAVWLGGYRPALLVAILGYLACAYLFIEPHGTLGLALAQNLIGLIAYLVTCSIIIGFCEVMRIAQRRAELRQEMLRVTLASIGDAVMVTDIEGRITSMNAVAESLTGWTQADAAGQPLDSVFRIVNEKTRQPVESPAQRALDEGVIVGLSNHTVLIRKDAGELAIDDSASPIRDAQGQVIGCVLVFRDITQRRRAEQERADETARIESVVNHVIDGIIAIDENGTVEAFNRAAEKLFGYQVAEVLGQNVKMLMPEPFHGEHDGYLANYRRTGQAKVIGIGREVEGRRKDGSTFPMELAVSEFWLSQRRYFTGIVRDITERKQAEERLRLKDVQLESITENTSAMLSRCSRDLRYIFVNRAYAELVRKPRDEIQGRPIVEIMGHQGFEIIRPHVTRVLRGEVVEYESIVPFEGVGPRFLHVRYVPDRDAQGEVVGWFASVADITERKRADARIHDLVADLKAADLRKDEFLATLAHELRGPLAPLHSALEILRLANHDPDLLQHSRATMERQLSHLERLIDDLLDVSRITRDKIDLRRDYVELASVIHQSLEACQPLAESAYHEISLTLPPQPIYLHADPVRLAQVFSNILNNACKYTEPGGRISLTAERQGSDAMIRIQDSGMGIPPDKLGSIFEMFAQTDRGSKRSQGGLGIGLWLVRRLVEMHGGSVEALSDGVGHGSEFIVRLPVLIERPVAPLPKPTAEPPTLTPRRFLIVDDSKDAAMSLAMLLKMSGNETRIAYDGLQAVEAARQFHPDVVLLDIGLPKLNGYDACRRIREQPEGKDMVMVALTGWGQEEDRRKSHEAGFDYHIVKPVDYRALMSLLAEKLPTEVEKRAE
jgi:PAS domain S-box-containing protein